MALRVLILILLALTATGAVLAKRNIRLGRGDRRGAFRLALALVGLGMAGWVLGAHHVADLGMEIALLARGAGLAVLLAALLWLFYLALEPYVRRLRPWTLISWTRLLGGGFRDAVVGRDVLIGMIWGAGLAVVLLVCERVPVWLGHAAPLPEGGFVDTLLGPGPRLSLVLGMPVNSTLLGLGALLLFLILRLLTRRDWLAAVLIVAILLVNQVGQAEESPWLMVPLGLIIFGTYVVLLLRFGVLSAIVGVYTLNLLIGPPQSTDPGSWTASATVVVVPLLLLLAVAAFQDRPSGAARAGGTSRATRLLAARLNGIGRYARTARPVTDGLFRMRTYYR